MGDQCLTKNEYHISTGKRSKLNHNIKLLTGNGLFIDFLYKTIKRKEVFNKIATTKPSITIVPSTAGSGITALVLPPFRMPYSTNLIIVEIIKQILQINTILEKKRKY